MHGFNSSTSRLRVEWLPLEIAGVIVHVRVSYEHRNNVRIAQGKHHVNLRIPSHCTQDERDGYKEWGREWVLEQWESNPQFRSAYKPLDVLRLGTLRTFDREFEVKSSLLNIKSAKGAVKPNEGKQGLISIKYPRQWNAQSRGEVGYRLIHRLLARYYRRDFETRMKALHGGLYSKRILSVRLKNMSTRWGSCSSTGKMSLSTRLLFAPLEVQDSVLIHELCHLDVLDHGSDFWRLLRERDPHCDASDDWLDEHGYSCDLMHHVEYGEVDSDREESGGELKPIETQSVEPSLSEEPEESGGQLSLF